MNKKHRASPIVLALLCAVGVHTILFTDAGHRIQGAITESTISDVGAEARLVKSDNTLSLVLGKDLQNVISIKASVSYDDGIIVLQKGKSTLGNISETQEEYSKNISLLFAQPVDISKGSTLATWNITKVLPEIQSINLFDVEVQTSERQEILNTQGTGEF